MRLNTPSGSLPSKYTQLVVNALHGEINDLAVCYTRHDYEVHFDRWTSKISKRRIKHFLKNLRIGSFTGSGLFCISDFLGSAPLPLEKNAVIQKIKAHLPVVPYPYAIPCIVSHEPVSHTHETIAAALNKPSNKYTKEYLIRRIIRFLRKLIVSIIRRMFIRSFIDLRQIFRNIIRFLFKNMDDCNSDDNALNPEPFPSQALLNLNSIIYGQSNSSQYTAGAH